MYQAKVGSLYNDGRSCPICTRCFHRCSARIPTITSHVDVPLWRENTVSLAKFYAWTNQVESTIRERRTLNKHHPRFSCPRERGNTEFGRAVPGNCQKLTLIRDARALFSFLFYTASNPIRLPKRLILYHALQAFVQGGDAHGALCRILSRVRLRARVVKPAPKCTIKTRISTVFFCASTRSE